MNTNRRTFLKLAGTAGASLGLAAHGFAQNIPTPTAAPTTPRSNRLPRWRGFNLQYLYHTGPGMLKPDEDHFRWMSGWGFDFARIPMTYRAWLKKKTREGESITPEDAFAIDESVLALVDEAVSFGEKHGIHVCLCFHHAPGYRVGKGVNEPFVLWRDSTAVEAFTFHWDLFAKRYRGVSAAKLSFNLFNEAPWPNDDFNGAIYRLAVEPAVAAIRRVSPDRIIIADGMGAGNLTVPELIPLGVNQSVHCYIPGTLSHYKVDWMKERKVWPEPRWPGAVDDNGYRWDRQRLEHYYAPWRDLIAQGVGVHLGETGGSHRPPAPILRAWLADVLGVFREMGVGFALWDFVGQSKFGILDSERADVDYADWHGHKLDRQMLEMLQRA